MKRFALVIFAKQPRPGSVKTRLCPPLTFHEATALYEAFLLDLFDGVRKLRRVDVWIAYAPRSAKSYFHKVVPRRFRLIQQSGKDLGLRMDRAFQGVFKTGYEGICLIGSDDPLLNASDLREAFEGLEKRAVVLGPTLDRGYYLIGLRQPRPELFAGVPWSTNRVWAETLRRVRRLGLDGRVLPRRRDIDHPADLKWLVRILRRDAAARRRLPHTWEVLRELKGHL
ncbi:MAG: TIGR04282 family arsenosugar biosynthesis glycosyltransferase [Nitrospirae bacterium]|nr:TIGR04282 family arsenosugar biosynthesis glycosyltransferase [Nitrospirota bacterium]